MGMNKVSDAYGSSDSLGGSSSSQQESMKTSSSEESASSHKSKGSVIAFWTFCYKEGDFSRALLTGASLRWRFLKPGSQSVSP